MSDFPSPGLSGQVATALRPKATCLHPNYAHMRSVHITLVVFQADCMQNSALKTSLWHAEGLYHSRAGVDEGVVQRRNCCCCVCSIHVASVVQMTHMLLVHGGVLKSKVMNRTQQLATYWSATVHDYEHGGLNNDFLIKTAHPLAIMYNDSSPLENHHLAASSRVLYTPEYCFPPVSLLSCCIAVSKALIDLSKLSEFHCKSARERYVNEIQARPGATSSYSDHLTHLAQPMLCTAVDAADIWTDRPLD